MDDQNLLWTCTACGKEDPAIFVDAEGLLHDEGHVCVPFTTTELDAAYRRALAMKPQIYRAPPPLLTEEWLEDEDRFLLATEGRLAGK